MPRTKGALEIAGFVNMASFVTLLSGPKNVEELAAKYDVQPTSVYAFKARKRAQIAAVLADWSNEFSDLWRVKKHNRVAELGWLADEQVARLGELKEDAERATETMRKIDPDAAPVRVPLRDWNARTRQLARLEAQIADEMGQNAAYIDALTRDAGLLFKMQQLGLRPSGRVKTQTKELRGESTDPTPEERERERCEGSRARTEARMQQLMASIRPSAMTPADADDYYGDVAEDAPSRAVEAEGWPRRSTGSARTPRKLSRRYALWPNGNLRMHSLSRGSADRRCLRVIAPACSPVLGLFVGELTVMR
jgi:hypothetical protein